MRVPGGALGSRGSVSDSHLCLSSPVHYFANQRLCGRFRQRGARHCGTRCATFAHCCFCLWLGKRWVGSAAVRCALCCDVRPYSWSVPFSYQIGSAFTAARLVRQSALAGHFPAILGQLWGRGTKAPVPALISQCQLVRISAKGRSRPAAAPLYLLTLTVVRDLLPGLTLDLIAVVMILAGNFSDLVWCLVFIHSAR